MCVEVDVCLVLDIILHLALDNTALEEQIVLMQTIYLDFAKAFDEIPQIG